MQFSSSEIDIDFLSIMTYGSRSAAAAVNRPTIYIRPGSNHIGKPGTDPNHPDRIIPGIRGVHGTSYNVPSTGDVLAATLMSTRNTMAEAEMVPFFSENSAWKTTWNNAYKREGYKWCLNSDF